MTIARRGTPISAPSFVLRALEIARGIERLYDGRVHTSFRMDSAKANQQGIRIESIYHIVNNASFRSGHMMHERAVSYWLSESR